LSGTLVPAATVQGHRLAAPQCRLRLFVEWVGDRRCEQPL